MIQPHFMVAAEPPRFAQPAKGSFDDPALGQDLKSPGLIASPHNFHSQPAKGPQGFDPLHQGPQITAVRSMSTRMAKSRFLCSIAGGNFALLNSSHIRFAIQRTELKFMSEFKFSCPQCDQHLQCDDQFSGRQIQCPRCNHLIRVPPVPGKTAPFDPQSGMTWATFVPTGEAESKKPPASEKKTPDKPDKK